jgi:hypothetical protein
MTPDEKLARIKAIYNSEHEEKDGLKRITHAYYNMAGALIDIERTGRCMQYRSLRSKEFMLN